MHSCFLEPSEIARVSTPLPELSSSDSSAVRFPAPLDGVDTAFGGLGPGTIDCIVQSSLCRTGNACG